MSPSISRWLVAAVLGTACGRPDTAARSTTRATTAASNGTLAPVVAHDSVTDRADRGRILGDSSAAIWMVIASDFQCPFCKQWHDQTFGSIERDYVRTGKVRVAYLNFPLNVHQNAMPSAEAAMCASVQGKFWPMEDALFATQEKWGQLTDTRRLFDSLAAGVGLSVPTWRQCVDKHATAALVLADRDRARTAGVATTPTFFIGRHKLEGAAPYQNFRDTIELALRESAKPGKPAPR
jgi:protein-disulfide isomerase